MRNTKRKNTRKQRNKRNVRVQHVCVNNKGTDVTSHENKKGDVKKKIIACVKNVFKNKSITNIIGSLIGTLIIGMIANLIYPEDKKIIVMYPVMVDNSVDKEDEKINDGIGEDELIDVMKVQQNEKKEEEEWTQTGSETLPASDIAMKRVSFDGQSNGMHDDKKEIEEKLEEPEERLYEVEKNEPEWVEDIYEDIQEEKESLTEGNYEQRVRVEEYLEKLKLLTDLLMELENEKELLKERKYELDSAVIMIEEQIEIEDSIWLIKGEDGNIKGIWSWDEELKNWEFELFEPWVYLPGIDRYELEVWSERPESVWYELESSDPPFEKLSEASIPSLPADPPMTMDDEITTLKKIAHNIEHSVSGGVDISMKYDSIRGEIGSSMDYKYILIPWIPIGVGLSFFIISMIILNLIPIIMKKNK